MNKLVKGSLAGAAGIALLLGGAGTFAYWNDQAGVQGGTIVAGQLDLADDGVAGVWKDQTGATINPATYHAAPGDVLTYTDSMNVTAVGDNLVATLALTGGAITATNAQNAADTALASFLTANTQLAASGTAITGTGPTFTVKKGTGVVTTTATLTFPMGTDTANNTAMLGSVNLSNMSVSLVQNHS
jgi:alternate signal-mediated exported protein